MAKIQDGSMGHGSMGHGSLVQWVTWVMGHKSDPLSALTSDMLTYAVRYRTSTGYAQLLMAHTRRSTLHFEFARLQL